MAIIALFLTCSKYQTFKNPKPALLEKLRESGPVPGDENGKKRGGEESAKKKKRVDKGVFCTAARLSALILICDNRLTWIN